MIGQRDVAVIGGGQAGLAMSACLSSAGIDHVVIERGEIGERWRFERWPSLRLLTPNWMTRLPGPAPVSQDPDGFMSTGEFVRELKSYSRRIAAPLVTRTVVLAVSQECARYRIVTSSGTFLTKAVVIATGACDRPSVPAWSADLAPSVRQVTPIRYRGPESLEPGGVLIVGASATGAQIARELSRAGRSVVLSAGRHVRVPRRYRGRDIFEWLDASGFLSDRTPEGADMTRLQSQPSLQLAGSRCDGEVGLPELAAEGVRIVGRALSGAGGLVRFGRDLAEQCLAADERRQKMLARIDAHITAAAPDVPEDRAAWKRAAPPPVGPSTLDLRSERIRTVFWATGYRREYPWLKVPVLDPAGEIRHAEGVTPAPGIFVLGLPFQRHRASAFIDGVGRDAEALLPVIIKHLTASRALAA
jgi:putative flavoprotein involved in K+ transport